MGGLFGSSKGTPAPEPVVPQAPVVNQDLVDRQASDLSRRRRGSLSTMTGAGTMGDTSGSIAAKRLLGE